MVKELVKDLLKYLPSMVVPAIVGIVALPIITRLFSPEDYGNYVLVLSTVHLSSIIAISWIASSIARFLPVFKLSNEVEKFLSTLLKLSLVSIAIVFFIVLGILFLVQSHISISLYYLLRIGLLLFIATSFFRLFISIFRAKRQVIKYTFFSIWCSVAGLGFGVAIVVIFHFGVEGLLWGSLMSIVIAIPLLWRISLDKSSFRKGNIRSSISLELAKFGIPAMTINLLTWILNLSDRYILEFFRGSREVGIYSVSYIISERSILLIASVFLLASRPIEYSIWENQGVEASQRYIKELARYYLLIGFPAVVGLSLLAKPIVGILAALEYQVGYKIVSMVAFGVLFVGISNIFSVGLGFYKRTGLLMLCYLGAGLVNIGLNFLFVPKYGYVGAAITTFISYACAALLVIVVSRRFFVWEFPFKSLAKTVCASGVMGIVVYFIGNRCSSSSLLNLILGIIVGVVVYLLMLFLLREFKQNEIQSLLTLKEKL